jgi:hypothetical protein
LVSEGVSVIRDPGADSLAFEHTRDVERLNACKGFRVSVIIGFYRGRFVGHFGNDNLRSRKSRAFDRCAQLDLCDGVDYYQSLAPEESLETVSALWQSKTLDRIGYSGEAVNTT